MAIVGKKNGEFEHIRDILKEMSHNSETVVTKTTINSTPMNNANLERFLSRMEEMELIENTGKTVYVQRAKNQEGKVYTLTKKGEELLEALDLGIELLTNPTDENVAALASLVTPSNMQENQRLSVGEVKPYVLDYSIDIGTRLRILEAATTENTAGVPHSVITRGATAAGPQLNVHLDDLYEKELIRNTNVNGFRKTTDLGEKTLFLWGRILDYIDNDIARTTARESRTV